MGAEMFPKRCCNCDGGPEEVERLVAGFGVYLCGPCAFAMMRTPHDDPIAAPYVGDAETARCSFCGKRRDDVEYVAVGKVREFVVCCECLALVADIVATAG